MQDFSLVRVLVVDDDSTQQALMLAFLEQVGVKHCKAVSNVEEAFEALLASDDNFQVVFTDKSMPDEVDGLDLILYIRSTSCLDHLKVAMISGELSHETEPPAAEVALRSILSRKKVLPIPKEGLDSTVVGRALAALIDT